MPDRRDIIWINCNPQAGREMKDFHPLIGLPMTTAAFNETNPFAVKYSGPRKQVSYILSHQPKSFDWRVRIAKSHPRKQVPEDVFELACESLNQIIKVA